MPNPPPGVKTGKAVLCAVSAQNAVLVGERQADDLEPLFLNPFIGAGRGLELLVAPQAVALDEAARRSFLR